MTEIETDSLWLMQGDCSCEDHEAEQYNHLPLAQSMGYSK